MTNLILLAALLCLTSCVHRNDGSEKLWVAICYEQGNCE